MSVVTLTTDFGDADAFVGMMKGVMLSIDPSVRFVDISHKVAPQNIREAAYLIATAFEYFPDDSVHLCIVDPGVGSNRRALAFKAGGHYFVGPDNGIFTNILRRYTSVKAYELANREKMVLSVSNTFHGRDVFAPASAWIAKGEPLHAFGPVIEKPVLLSLPEQLRSAPNLIEGEVVHIDNFGNAITNITQNLVEHVRLDFKAERMEIAIKSHLLTEIMQSYSFADDKKTLSALFSSFGTLEFFVKNGSANSMFELSPGDHVEIRFF